MITKDMIKKGFERNIISILGGDLIMKYKVRYIDNTHSNDSVEEFNTEEEAERFIEDGLKLCKECNKDYEYDYGDFGNTTEFWVCDDIEYASWERLWM